MLRPTLLWLSKRHGVFRFVKNNKLARRFADRFVAGEMIDTAIAAVKSLNAKGISATLDLLGESVASASEATATADHYVDMLRRIHAQGLNANVSVKLTAMGQDVDEELCRTNILRVLAVAKECNNFVRLDMESSAYTQRTLDLFHRHLFPAFPENVGVVLQSYLYRTEADVEAAIAQQYHVRLCKGAYKEPATVAFPAKLDVDKNYVACAKRLLREGKYPGLATHDERIIADLRAWVGQEGIAADAFEFQMLYGVRRDIQEALVRNGFRMRVYVPFGTQWYPYLMRRLAERPANIAFMTGSILKERFRGHR